MQWISVIKTNHAIHWMVVYPVDSVNHLLNKPDLLKTLTLGGVGDGTVFSTVTISQLDYELEISIA